MWKWGGTTGIRGAGILPPEWGDWFNHVTVCTGGRNGKCLASSSPPSLVLRSVWAQGLKQGKRSTLSSPSIILYCLDLPVDRPISYRLSQFNSNTFAVLIMEIVALLLLDSRTRQ